MKFHISGRQVLYIKWKPLNSHQVYNEEFNRLYASALQERVHRLGFSGWVSYTTNTAEFSLGFKKIVFWNREFPFIYLTDEYNPRLADFGVLDPVKSLILEFYIDPLDEWIFNYLKGRDMYTNYVTSQKWKYITGLYPNFSKTKIQNGSLDR